MKNLIFAIVLALTSFTVGAAQNAIDSAGAVKTLHKRYLVVVNSASAALTEGEFVGLDLTLDDGISVDYVYTGSAKALCMIVDVSCAVGARCLCQTFGIVEIADFDAVGGSATAGGPGFANTSGQVVVDSSIGAADYPVGTFLDASSATGDVQFYIQLEGGE